jgi:cytochrome c-type biogenesis protein CcmH/NrfF
LPERSAIYVLVLALSVGALPAQNVPPAARADFEQATSTILCDCGCHPQSVKACACGRAAEMREDMAALVRQGMSGEQIVDQYVATHGEQIRITPTATGFNLVAWLGPLLGLFAAIGGLLLVLRRWRGVPSAESGPAPATPDAVDRKRLDRALEQFE